MASDPFASALAAAGRDFRGRPIAPGGTGAPAKVAALPPAPAKLAPNAIHLGADEYGKPVTADLLALLSGRLLIQAVSGAGKSWTLRRLLETSAAMIQQIVVDPEGEFRTLAEELNYPCIATERLDAGALADLALRVRDHRASIVLDMSQMDTEDQMHALAAFVTALIRAPKEMWTPVLIAIDEAQLFAPFGGHMEANAVRKEAVAALVDLMGRGRKRGLVGILSTRRLARLAKSVVAEAQNFLVGLNTLDLDIRRAGELIGWGNRKASDRLPLLDPGQFVAVGSAFSASPALIRIGPVRSRHVGATPSLLPLPLRAGALGIDELMARSATEADATERRDNPGLVAVRRFIRDAAFHDAGRLYKALKPLFPAGAALADLERELFLSTDALAQAIALLDQYRVVELTETETGPAVRIDSKFARWRM